MRAHNFNVNFYLYIPHHYPRSTFILPRNKKKGREKLHPPNPYSVILYVYYTLNMIRTWAPDQVLHDDEFLNEIFNAILV